MCNGQFFAISYNITIYPKTAMFYYMIYTYKQYTGQLFCLHIFNILRSDRCPIIYNTSSTKYLDDKALLLIFNLMNCSVPLKFKNNLNQDYSVFAFSFL